MRKGALISRSVTALLLPKANTYVGEISKQPKIVSTVEIVHFSGRKRSEHSIY